MESHLSNLSDLAEVARTPSHHKRVCFFDIYPSTSGPNMICFSLLTWKCASRQSGMQILDIFSSKSGPTMVRFAHFGLEMRVVPQRRATFHVSSGQMSLLFDPPDPQSIGKEHCFLAFLTFRRPVPSFF